MNAERLIRRGLNMLMRYGMRRLAKGQTQNSNDPQARQAAKKMRMLNRIRRM